MNDKSRSRLQGINFRDVIIFIDEVYAKSHAIYIIEDKGNIFKKKLYLLCKERIGKTVLFLCFLLKDNKN